ncbi:cytochrome-c peroxidase [Gilvimarinus sp. F26214L]|uniref:cytochrome-c peroxidase n=1 Tax=Gilvimarinus sp. DZF01 TaxID=3461371 RepID=UPI00404592BF
MKAPRLVVAPLIAAVVTITALQIAERLGLCAPLLCTNPTWTSEQVRLIHSLSLSALPPPPRDESNEVADDPRAARLGQQLFFDTRLSADGSISCATCHQPDRYFTDGRPQGRALGHSKRNTPTIVGSAYSPWLYWDGRRDSLWAQALTPLEDPVEHGSNRVRIAKLIARDRRYREAYEIIFGALPDLSPAGRFPEDASPVHDGAGALAWSSMAAEDRHSINRIFANVGKAIAAYETSLVPGESRFDRYAAWLVGESFEPSDEPEPTGPTGSPPNEPHLSEAERRGLGLFIGKARCIECHNGPLFSNNEFHNTGVISAAGQLPDRGRSAGIPRLESDPFNCLGAYSHRAADDCIELRFMRRGSELLGAFRTPSLRNVAETGPYMHKGQLQTMKSVLDHYNAAPEALIGHNEAEPLGLNRRELNDLEAFLHSLSAPARSLPSQFRSITRRGRQ